MVFKWKRVGVSSRRHFVDGAECVGGRAVLVAPKALVGTLRRTIRDVNPVLDSTFHLAHNVLVGQTGAAAQPATKVARGMPEFFSHPLSQAALWFAAIFALLALAVLGLRKWRGGSADDQLSASELLIKFRELHLRGSLSEDEYRTIKTKLAGQLEARLNDNDKMS
jgi:hypothetical protein